MNLMKKLTSMVLAAALAAGLCVSAFAAAPAYSVTVQTGKVTLNQSGKAVKTYETKNTDIALTTDKAGDFLVCYYNAAGQYKGISLGKQTALTIGGKMNSLTINKELSDSIAITLAAGSDVKTMTVASPNAVTINGKVGQLNVSAAAKVTIDKNAAVTKSSVTDKKASVTGNKGTASSTKPASTSKPAASASSAGSAALTVTCKPIYADEGDSLSDLVDKLNDNVEARDKVTRDFVSGTAVWATNRTSELTDDGTYPFLFTPDTNDYAPIKGTVKIYAGGNAGEITLGFNGSAVLTVQAGDKLSSLTDALNDLVYATDSDGDDVEGKAKFKSSSTKFSSGEKDRTYSFTFTPKNSRYEKKDGSVTIHVVD